MIGVISCKLQKIEMFYYAAMKME